jgi:hypothetical protein
MTEQEAKALWELAFDFAKLAEHAGSRKMEGLNHDCNAGIEVSYRDAYTRLERLLPPIDTPERKGLADDAKPAADDCGSLTNNDSGIT